eukprot:4714799-Lingulodinium_polyedra.AAC.1
MEHASVRFVSRCSSETSIRPRHSAAFAKRCAMTRSIRRVTAIAARKPRARALHARTEKRSA